MGLRKSKKTGFHSISEKHTKEGDHGINLCIGVRSIGIIKSETKEANAKIQKSGHDTRHSIPKGLSCQFFNTAQIVGFDKNTI